MTDDLDDLQAALNRATPRPDPATRAAHLRLAQENFAALQGSRDAARQTSATGHRGLWTGVKTMLSNLTSKGGLTGTTALVAVGFLALTPVGQKVLQGPVGKTVADSDPLPMPEMDQPMMTPDRSAVNAAPQDDGAVAAPEPRPRVALDTARTLSQDAILGGAPNPMEMRETQSETADMIAAPPPVAAAPVARTESNAQNFAAAAPQDVFR